MEHGLRDGAGRFILFLTMAGLLVNGVDSYGTMKTRLPVSLKTISGHIHLLRQCRRQLTFLASVALGAFITRVIHESPLTPLPMPPVKEPAQWTFLTLPLHAVDPFLRWTKQSLAANPQLFHQSLNQAVDYGSPLMLHREDLDDASSGILSWIRAPRFRRHLSRFVKSSPGLIVKAVTRAINSVGSTLMSQDASTRQWLLRLCF